MALGRSARDQVAVEWPTVFLALFIYGAWLLVTYHQATLPWWIVSPVLAWLLAWQTSLQHEILHGHPTKWRWVNRLIATPSLCLWLPYESYRVSHLIHHRDERLTDPFDDPESYYWTPEDWAKVSRPKALILMAQTTLFGRLLIGPLWIIPRFVYREIRALLAGKKVQVYGWPRHVIAVVLLLVWLVAVCKMSLVYYVFGVIYPGASLMLLRSFAEHNAAENFQERTAIVENAGPFGWLYLYNNLHSVHHEEPMIPWYRYNAYYRQHRDRLLQDNGGLLYQGYGDVARRYLFRRYSGPVHPFGRAP